MSKSGFPTVVHLEPPPGLSDQAQDRSPYLLFFIPGNPGPIAYYRMFLSALSSSLCPSPENEVSQPQFDIFARSLSGFELDEARGGGWPAAKRLGQAPPFSLPEQIEGVKWSLEDHVEGLKADGKHLGSKGPPKVVLLGHGLGAYIALDIVKRWHKARIECASADCGGDRRDVPMKETPDFEVAGAICLFSAASVGNWWWKLCRLLSHSAWIIMFPLHLVSNLLICLLPSALLRSVLCTVMSLSQETADITLQVVKSRWGTWQSMMLMRDELLSPTDNVLRGFVHQSHAFNSVCPTFLLFDKNNRETLCKQKEEKLSQGGGIYKAALPDHFFASQHESKRVAELVQEYVQEIIKLDLEKGF